MKLVNHKFALIVGLAICVASCSPNKSAEEHILEANKYIELNKNADAVIELKNAIRINGNDASTRFMLGKLYLLNGQASFAEKELQRAYGLGLENKTLIPKLLKSYNLQDKNEEIITLVNEIQEKGGILTPEILLYFSLAHGRLGNDSQAKGIISQANDISADSVFSQLGDAYLEANGKEIDRALLIVESVLKEEPLFTEAQLLKGQLLAIKKDFVGAIDSFKRFHELLPNDLKIKIFLANAYVQNKEFKEADKHVNDLLNLVPEHAYTNQLKGVIYYQEQSFDLALRHTEKAIQNGLNTSSNRVVAGLSAFKLGHYEQAYQFLNTITDSLSQNHPVRRVLVLVQMQLGYNLEASETINDITDLNESDIELLTLASYQLVKEGNLNKAMLLLDKVNKPTESDARITAKFGALKMALNDLDGILDLEKAVEIEPDLPMARMALAAAYIESKNFVKAHALAKQWQVKNPNKVDGYNLAARIFLLQENIIDAEKQMALALAINENNIYSLLYFSSKYLSEGAPEKAIEPLEKILKDKPDNTAALVRIYKAHSLLGNVNGALKLLKSAFERHSKNLEYRLLYSRALFSDKQYKEVVTLLKDVDSNTPYIFWVLLGDSYMGMKKYELALRSFDNLIKERPDLLASWLKNIFALESKKDIVGALELIQKALVLSPGNKQLLVLRIYYLVQNNDVELADKYFNELPSTYREENIVKGLHGQILLAKREYIKALPNLYALYELADTSRTCILIYRALTETNQNQEAFDFLLKHTQKHENDYVSQQLLAELATTYDKALAKKIYYRLLSKAPENIGILNNLALIELDLGMLLEADKLAEKAYKLFPEHPQILDTLGMVKFKLGHKNLALQYLTLARKLTPDDMEIKEHYNLVNK